MIAIVRVFGAVALIICCAALSLAQNANSASAAAATSSNPVLLIAGGAGLALAGLAIGFALGRSSAKKN